jgi:hypothetical protein
MPFEFGSFDIVIGNPPYVRQEMIKEIKPHLEKLYLTYNGNADLYIYFIELALKLLKNGGYLSYIFPNKWLKTTYGKSLRVYLKEFDIRSIIDFGDLQIFEEATTYPLILVLSKNPPIRKIKIQLLKSLENIQKDLGNFTEEIAIESLKDDGWEISGVNLILKIRQSSISVETYTKGKIIRGVVTGFNEAFVIDQKIRDVLVLKDIKSVEIIKPLLRGRDIGKYQIYFDDQQYLISPNSKTNIEDYFAVYKHLLNYKAQLEKRAGKQAWWQLQSSSEKDFSVPKIIYMAMQVKPAFALDFSGSWINNSIFTFLENDKYFLAYMNSQLGWFLISKYCTQIQNGFQLIYDYFKQIPIKQISETEQQPFIERVDKLLELNKNLQKNRTQFLDELKLEKISQKLENFEKLSLDEFIVEFAKAHKIKLSDKLAERNLKNEWKSIFENDKSLIIKISSEIKKLETEIDNLVYKLYDLNSDEIMIIEGR